MMEYAHSRADRGERAVSDGFRFCRFSREPTEIKII